MKKCMMFSKSPLVLSIMVSVVIVYLILFKYLGIEHNSNLFKNEHLFKSIKIIIMGCFCISYISK